jgi:DNA-binding transcriptional MerR regulator
MVNIGEFARLGQVSPRMLRHYDEVGLLRPERVDPATAYRSYAVHQLGRLHRLLALRDLGFTLEQIGAILEDDPPVEQFRGMLRIRRAQMEESVAEEQARLRRIEARLRALERSETVDVQDIVIKQTQPLRMAEAAATAPGFGHENLGPVFGRLLPAVLAHVEGVGAKPGISVAHYEDLADDGSVVLHAGFDIGDQDIPDGDGVRIVDLPVMGVASIVHRGPMDTIEIVYEGLIRWVEDSGYRLAGLSRELYHEWHDEDPDRQVTELQLPLAPTSGPAPVR